MSGLLILIGMIVPQLMHAQEVGYLTGLHTVLDKLYVDMMPLCKDLRDVSRGIAGFAAVFTLVTGCGSISLMQKLWRCFHY